MEELVIKQDRQGRVLVACLDNPPVNALGAGLRRQLMAVVGDFRRDESASALVITATGRMFSAGADIREFAKPPTLPAPSLPALIEAIEDCDKPVIAAINGDALGGGL
ncbi:MAG: enoyl-CoA hydratase/isomerase family protein, partial [Steroidobacteraceae bacterium]